MSDGKILSRAFLEKIAGEGVIEEQDAALARQRDAASAKASEPSNTELARQLLIDVANMLEPGRNYGPGTIERIRLAARRLSAPTRHQ
jgi:hypothetical protein